jgi:hypothetical protein
MGKIPAGIMGGVKGKVGGIIGAAWHGINYIKTYVIPTNPNTPGQQTQRGKMKLCISLSKQSLEPIIHVFWNPFAEYKSGIHLFTSTNLLRVADDSDYENILMSQGALEVPEFIAVDPISYNGTSGEITLSWNNNPVGNGLASDYMGFFVFDVGAVFGIANVGECTRDPGYYIFDIGAGRTITDLCAWCFAYRYDNSVPFVSNSDFATMGP